MIAARQGLSNSVQVNRLYGVSSLAIMYCVAGWPTIPDEDHVYSVGSGIHATSCLVALEAASCLDQYRLACWLAFQAP